MLLWHRGNYERTKTCVHGAACALGLVMAGYNAIAWLIRRERHLAMHTAIYAAAVWWEVHQTGHHWELIARTHAANDAGHERARVA